MINDSYILEEMKHDPELETQPHSCCSNKNIISAASVDICKCEPGLCQKDGVCCPGCPGNDMQICSKVEPNYFTDISVHQVPESYVLASSNIHESPPSLVHCS